MERHDIWSELGWGVEKHVAFGVQNL